jgi:hypothetical protein
VLWPRNETQASEASSFFGHLTRYIRLSYQRTWRSCASGSPAGRLFPMGDFEAQIPSAASWEFVMVKAGHIQDRAAKLADDLQWVCLVRKRNLDWRSDKGIFRFEVIAQTLAPCRCHSRNARDLFEPIFEQPQPCRTNVRKCRGLKRHSSEVALLSFPTGCGWHRRRPTAACLPVVPRRLRQSIVEATSPRLSGRPRGPQASM